MKAIITFLLLFISVLTYSQSEKYFNYEISKFSRPRVDTTYSITPKFEECPYKQEDFGLFDFKDGAGMYVRRFVNNITKAVLKDTVEMLEYRLGKDSEASWAKVTLYIDEEGNIRYIFLSITKNDRKFLSDALLYELYQKFKATKFDMRVGVFRSKTGDAPTGKCFTIVMSLYTKIFHNKAL